MMGTILLWIWLLGCIPATYVAIMECAKQAREDDENSLAVFLIFFFCVGIWAVPCWPVIAPVWGIGKGLGLK